MLGTLKSWKENEKLLTRHILLFFFFGKTQLKKKKEKRKKGHALITTPLDAP